MYNYVDGPEIVDNRQRQFTVKYILINKNSFVRILK